MLISRKELTTGSLHGNGVRNGTTLISERNLIACDANGRKKVNFNEYFGTAFLDD
jgi:hypothetical protein